MTRGLNTAVLDGAAKFYARQWLSPDIPNPNQEGMWRGGPSLVLRDLYNLTFKDAFEYVLQGIRDNLGKKALADFDAAWAKTAKPREDKVFHELLKTKLAVGPDGEHLDGVIGTTQIDNRIVGKRVVIHKRKGARPDLAMVKNAYWPVYAGEGHERAAYSDVADELPEDAEPLSVGALNTRVANVIAIELCDAMVDHLDEGTGAATIRGRVGAQPAGADETESGTLLFTLTCNATSFGAASDAGPGGIATAASISDDTNADASGTLGYCRAGSIGSGGGAPDDLIDGEAQTSGGDFNFNTLSIVAGATVSMTSWTVTMPES